MAEPLDIVMKVIRCSSLSRSQLQFLATHLVAEFGRLYPQWDSVIAAEELAQDSGQGLPLHIAAIEDGRPLGVTSVISDDEVTGWESKGWWLANVLVLPEYRGRGIGRVLVDRAIEIASESGARELHLVTDSVENWYLMHGWEPVGVGEVHGNEMVVMHRVLGENK